MIDSRKKLQLTPNLLLEWAQSQGEANATPVIERVLDFDAASDEVVVINILDRGAFPADLIGNRNFAAVCKVVRRRAGQNPFRP